MVRTMDSCLVLLPMCTGKRGCATIVLSLSNTKRGYARCGRDTVTEGHDIVICFPVGGVPSLSGR
jgi:hypothetical protein